MNCAPPDETVRRGALYFHSFFCRRGIAQNMSTEGTTGKHCKNVINLVKSMQLRKNGVEE